jgi:steroid 5-alpha reductase family enzyme
MLDSFLDMSLIGLGIMMILMLAVWLIHLPLKNAGLVDVAWAFGLAVLAVTYSFLGNGDPLRKWLLSGMAAVWGLRLALHLLRRTIGQDEDGRYQQMRKEWGGRIEIKFLAFFQFQALLNVVLALPFLLVSINPEKGLSAFEFTGLVIWIAALIGESVADQQLKLFKSDPANKGKTCRQGLWNYSRHPNYFFEWLVWVAYFVFALGTPYGWISIIGPILMLYFLFKVTGIPATEAQALRTRGDDYRDYQRTTSAFVPWLKNKQTSTQ